MRDDRELDGAWRRHQTHSRLAPAADLAPFVDHYWAVTWAYAEPYRQKVPPSVSVHVTARDGDPPVWQGVTTRHVVRELGGRGGVVGAALRPGTARAVLGRPVRTLTDASTPAGGPAGIVGTGALEAWLRTLLPATPSPAALEAAAAVDLVRTDPGITRVEELARRCGCHVRRLQRLFAEHVGVGPKWVVRRYRLHEVTERLDAGRAVAWAQVAAELGFADQAHLVREFTALVGESPTAYAARYPPGEIL
ncbi:helix-turn-helix domain-containing protein [Actinomycetospora atypica]|uniref:Helix-turn-helix domain-containing protein n=1 Tax=Actinomycetospora atypica TaxID=1290095 RepID=A0ABV9YUZ8_9PSEU